MAVALIATALVDRSRTERFLKLDVGADTHDNLLEEIINSATAICERWADRALAARAYLDERPVGNPDGQTRMLLREYPVVDIAEIRTSTLDLDSFGVLPATDYELDRPGGENGIVLLKAGQFLRGTWPDARAIKVDYTAGFGWDSGGSVFDVDLVPDDLATACLIMCGELFTMIQRKDFRVSSRALEGVTASFIRPTDIPPEARMILERYRRLSVGF